MTNCHPSCATCTSSSYTACSSCSTSVVLYQSVCYCQSWNSQCCVNPTYKEAFEIINVFINLLFLLVIILYLCRVRIPLSYRLSSGMQALSLLFYSKVFYIPYDTSFILKAYSTLNGPYRLNYRLESISMSYATPTLVLLIIFFLIYILSYGMYNALIQPCNGYFPYLKKSFFYFLESFYYFGSKMMFFFIGKYISTLSLDAGLIFILVIYSLLIIATIIEIISNYHKNTLDNKIFSNQLYLHSVLSSVTMLGVPLSDSRMLLCIIYFIPIILICLIMLLNKDVKVFTKNNIIYYIGQATMAIISICFILIGAEAQNYLLLFTAYGLSLAILLEIIYIYHIGAYKPQSLKVHPGTQENEKKSKINNKSESRIPSRTYSTKMNGAQSEKKSNIQF